MKVKRLIDEIAKSGINCITGVPDSTLKPLCDYLNAADKLGLDHIVAPNEGSAVGIAIGTYLATGKAACLYLQNSGMGNIVNPVTSLACQEIYGIPILFIIGWRGEPGTTDEPQHKFMGKLTEPLLRLLNIEYSIIDSNTSDDRLAEIMKKAEKAFNHQMQYAIIVAKGALAGERIGTYTNEYRITREQAIRQIVRSLSASDRLVSTTGKISRELYEQCNEMLGNHRQVFLTVGGMGHASMIAYGLALNKPSNRIICLDGDGAILMHMGSLALIGKTKPCNLIHICMNNQAHESVGGMPTCAVGISYAAVAASCGYPKVYTVNTMDELNNTLDKLSHSDECTFIELRVAAGSRNDLGRPLETPRENKASFMKYSEEN